MDSVVLRGPVHPSPAGWFIGSLHFTQPGHDGPPDCAHGEVRVGAATTYLVTAEAVEPQPRLRSPKAFEAHVRPPLLLARRSDLRPLRPSRRRGRDVAPRRDANGRGFRSATMPRPSRWWRNW